MNNTFQSTARRAPLGEATRRVNNTQHQAQHDEKPLPMPHHESRATNQSRRPTDTQRLRVPAQYAPDTFNAVNPRLSAIANEYPASHRNSQISTTSTNSEGKSLKKCIGPWKLGKTLGKGATARVRLARHIITGQEAAVKIVQKENAYLSQAGSLADLDQAESKILEPEDGLRRMPVGIEREVAIMKLIQHPHIMKLHDIWENRTEIYLVLEYIENGELFEYITNAESGRLPEEEALRCFRQILSAVGYCHSFHICHRDLKPENILLTKTGQIKVADFGMAALHQSPDHKLKTACGSPHYAAPELIKGAAYKGDMVDIWSMGVILYAALSGRLPFDVDGSQNNVARLLAKIKKGQYEMAAEFSNEAKSLLRKMLQVNPKDRITISQIWKHPLLKKYDYLDNLSGGNFPQSPSLKQCDRPVLKRSDISKDLVRNLRSLWHRLSEQQIMDALLSDEPNEQKLFYSLLVKYRDAQLENYVPDIEYSASDYHHTKPRHLTKTYSTCQFPPVKSKGHGRQMSKFTVISNGGDTERSYDPFKASRPQYLNGIRDDRAFITVHRPENAAKLSDVSTNLKQAQRPIGSNQNKQRLAPPPKMFGSRTSMASSTRSRNSNPHARVGLSYKRGVSFAHIRRHSLDSQPTPTKNVRHSNYTEVTDDGGESLRALKSTSSPNHCIRSRKPQGKRPRPMSSPAKSGRASLLWGEDVRQLSSSLAKDCDEAFNRTSTVSEAVTSENIKSTTNRNLLTNPAKNHLLAPKPNTDRLSLEYRPLPRAPARTDSMEIELLQARKMAELRKQSGEGDSPRYLDRMVSHFDDLIRPSSPSHDRRINSAPVDTRHLSLGRLLPSIHETRYEDSPRRGLKTASLPVHERRTERKNSRIASAPEPRESSRQDRFTRPESNVRETIRVVTTTSDESPVRAPAPLFIRKKSSQSGPPTMISGAFRADGNQPNWRRPSGAGLRDQYQTHAEADLERIAEVGDDYDFENESTSSTVRKKKSSWFKRSSKSEEDNGQMEDSWSSNHDIVQPPYERPRNPHLVTSPGEAPKKRGFNLGRLFKRRNSKPDMMVSNLDAFDDNESISDSVVDYQQRAGGSDKVRQIAPQRNWIAKLFNVKPQARYICFSVSKRKARQEIGSLLKDWKKFGIRDVQVDKERNIVFGRVASQNYLQMREVAFASEVMTVIEHGKRSALSIARFTQEHGAASSFQKVVDTLQEVLKCKTLLVTDERKKRMMIKTLNSA